MKHLLILLLLPLQLLAQISLSNRTGVTIEGEHFDGIQANLIVLQNCADITIRRSTFKNTVSAAEIQAIQAAYVTAGMGGSASHLVFRQNGGYSQNTRLAIYLIGCRNITVEGCYFENVESALYAVNCTGPIVFRNNEVKNVQGPFPRGQAAQLNGCKGGGVRLELNHVTNDRNASAPEDVFNLYKCEGLPDDPMRVQFNYIKGHGPSNSGTASIVGDGGASKYLSINDNVCINTNGISIAGGDNCQLVNNVMFNAGTDRSNVGLVVANFYKALPCSNHKVIGNRVRWTNKAGVNNPIWLGGGTYPPCAGVEVTGNDLAANITAEYPAPAGVGIRPDVMPCDTVYLPGDTIFIERIEYIERIDTVYINEIRPFKLIGLKWFFRVTK